MEIFGKIIEIVLIVNATSQTWSTSLNLLERSLCDIYESCQRGSLKELNTIRWINYWFYFILFLSDLLEDVSVVVCKQTHSFFPADSCHHCLLDDTDLPPHLANQDILVSKISVCRQTPKLPRIQTQLIKPTLTLTLSHLFDFSSAVLQNTLY